MSFHSTAQHMIIEVTLTLIAQQNKTDVLAEAVLAQRTGKVSSYMYFSTGGLTRPAGRLWTASLADKQ